jgi:hypothetical protein
MIQNLNDLGQYENFDKNLKQNYIISDDVHIQISGTRSRHRQEARRKVKI